MITLGLCDLTEEVAGISGIILALILKGHVRGTPKTDLNEFSASSKVDGQSQERDPEDIGIFYWLRLVS